MTEDSNKWYPAVICWPEGFFPTAIQKGATIDTRTSSYRNEKFDTKQQAKDRAYEKDYEEGHDGWINIDTDEIGSLFLPKDD